jgi:DNA-binding response OmpR family regulator
MLHIPHVDFFRFFAADRFAADEQQDDDEQHWQQTAVPIANDMKHADSFPSLVFTFTVILPMKCCDLVMICCPLCESIPQSGGHRYNVGKATVTEGGHEAMRHTILLVDDEEKVLEVIAPFLLQEGYDVVTATTGKEALRLAREVKPSVIVLDWMMPEMSGIDVCRELRQTSRVGIIMLTARTDETDKIIGLEVGADDYLTKPFSWRELVARVRSLLRRMDGIELVAKTLERGDLAISEQQCRVWKRGAEIPLTPTEFKMLLTLAAKPGIVYSRLQLLQAAFEDDMFNDERTVDAHVSKLRKKIEDDPASPIYIQTVYGFGYRFGDRL